MGGSLNDQRSGAGYRPMSEINVTPLVDVMLVLLIIFMVTMPMLVAGMPVNLPNATTAKPLEPKAPITVTITKDGRVLIGDEEVERDKLAALIKAQIGDDAERVVRLRGDQDTAFGGVVSVLDDLSAHGLTRVAIVTATGGSKPQRRDMPNVPEEGGAAARSQP